MAELNKFFQMVKDAKASDLIVSTGIPITMKVHGEITPMNDTVLEPHQAKALIYGILKPEQIQEVERELELDCSYDLKGIGRFRSNVFIHRRGIGAVFRLIPEEIPTLESLQLPKVIKDLITCDRGIVLVTGATGSGKSTTLAAMINYINETCSGHIVTVEDPVEFVHANKKCLVRQREVKSHTKTFANALKASLRQDPDIIMVGEMRDLETISLAMTAAETGHLVFGTLHTGSAAKTVDRIISVFPIEQQAQVRVMFSESLRGIVTQTLFKRADGKGRVAAFEILVNTKGIGHLVRDNRSFQIPSQMQVGKHLGMQLFETEVADMAQKGIISQEEAKAFLGKSSGPSKPAPALHIVPNPAAAPPMAAKPIVTAAAAKPATPAPAVAKPATASPATLKVVPAMPAQPLPPKPQTAAPVASPKPSVPPTIIKIDPVTLKKIG